MEFNLLIPSLRLGNQIFLRIMAKARVTLTSHMLFKYPKFFSKYIGTWPAYKLRQRIPLTFITIFTIAMANFTQWYFIVEHIYLWTHSGNWLNAFDSMITTLVLMVSFVKAMFVGLGHQDLIKVVTFLQVQMLAKGIFLIKTIAPVEKQSKLYFFNNHTGIHPKSQNLYLFRCKMASFINIILSGFGFICVISYVSFPIVYNIIRYTRGEQIVKEPPLPVK